MNVSQFMQYLMANNIGNILNSKTANIGKIEQSVARMENDLNTKFRLAITENLPAIYLIDIGNIVDIFINVFDPANPNSAITYKQVLSSFTINNVTYNIRELYTETSLEDEESYDRLIHSIHSTLWHKRDTIVKSMLAALRGKVSKKINFNNLVNTVSEELSNIEKAKKAFGILESMSGDIDTSVSRSSIVQNLNKDIATVGKKLQAFYSKYTPSQIDKPETIISNYDNNRHLLIFGGSFETLKTFINSEINKNLELFLTKGIGGKSLFVKGTSLNFASYGYIEDYGFTGNLGKNKFFREQAQKNRGQVVGISIGNLVAAGHTGAVTTNNGITEVLAINTPLTIKTMLALNEAGISKGYDVSKYVTSTPHLKHSLQFTKQASSGAQTLAKGLFQFVVEMETNYNSITVGREEKRQLDIQTSALIKKKTDEINTAFINTLLAPKTLRIMLGALRWSPTIEEDIISNISLILKTGKHSKKAPAIATANAESIFKGLKVALPSSKIIKNTNISASGSTAKLNPVKLKSPKIPKSSGNATKFISILPTLQALLDSSLTEKIKQNMQRPALQNRTGRFAESVKVERLSESRAGMITAFYRYMRSPYQTFEPGFAQGSNKRNPKTLISKSIRDIASTVVGNRLRAVSI